jgi:hypothetical protein
MVWSQQVLLPEWVKTRCATTQAAMSGSDQLRDVLLLNFASPHQEAAIMLYELRNIMSAVNRSAAAIRLWMRALCVHDLVPTATLSLHAVEPAQREPS